MILRRAFIAGLLLLLASPTIAATWVRVGAGSKVVVLVDRDSLRRTGAKVKVWINWVYQEPIELEGTYPKKQYKSMKSLAIYNCTELTTITLQQTVYADDDGGEVVNSEAQQETPGRYREIVPDSVGESILNYACKATAGRR